MTPELELLDKIKEMVDQVNTAHNDAIVTTACREIGFNLGNIRKRVEIPKFQREFEAKLDAFDIATQNYGSIAGEGSDIAIEKALDAYQEARKVLVEFTLGHFRDFGFNSLNNRIESK